MYLYIHVCITEGIWLKTVKSSVPQFNSTVCSYIIIFESKVNYGYILIYSF